MSKNINGIPELSIADYNVDDQELFDLNKVVSEITFILNPPDEMPILCDTAIREFKTHYTPLVQIIHTLIESAIENHYSEKGAVVVFASETNESINFTISDDGPGVPKKVEDILNNNDSNNDELDSSTYGLLMAKSLIEQFNGKMTVKSKEGKGTAVHFSWPKN